MIHSKISGGKSNLPPCCLLVTGPLRNRCATTVVETESNWVQRLNPYFLGNHHSTACSSMMIMFELWSIKLKLFELFSDWVLDSGEEGVLINRCTTRTGVLQELLTELVPLFILYGIHQQTEQREILQMTWVCQEKDCLLARSNKTATAHYFRKVPFSLAAQLSVQNVWIHCHLIILPYTL